MKLLLFGFIVAYNPWYINYLMENGALGGMSIRIWSGTAILALFLMATFLRVMRKTTFTLNTPIFPHMAIFSALALAYIARGYMVNDDRVMVIADSYPLIEFIGIFYTVRFLPQNVDSTGNERFLRWILVFLLVMGLTDIASYLYLTFIKGVSFGALRADVGGTVVNRMMDFVIPMAAPILLFYKGKAMPRKWLILLSTVSLIVMMLTFFRTVYVSFLVTVLFLSIKESKKMFRNILWGGMALGLVFWVVHLAETEFGMKYSEQGIASLALARITTIFTERESDFAITARFEHNLQMIKEISDVILLGDGAGAVFDDGVAVQYTSNYFLQLAFILGVPGVGLFIWIYAKVFLVSFRFSAKDKDSEARLLYLTFTSLLVSMAVILSFFPYTVYFPLMYILGAIFALFDRSFERINIRKPRL